MRNLSSGKQLPLIGFLDRQRQEIRSLVDALGVFIDNLKAGNASSAAIRQAYHWKLNDLFEAARKHFRCEANLYEAVRYSFWAQHQTQHDEFIEMMSAALLDLSTERGVDIYTTFKHITDWINKHERDYSGTSCSNDQHRSRSYKFAAVGDLPHLSGRVLVAEDDWASRKVAEVFLTRLGLTPVFAEDGQQLLEAIIKGDPADLILMDVCMPVLDGYSATQRIRQFEIENGEAKRSIIALTAAAYEEDRQRCLDVGMDDVLTKPLDLTNLIAVLARWLPKEPADLIAKSSEQRAVGGRQRR